MPAATSWPSPSWPTRSPRAANWSARRARSTRWRRPWRAAAAAERALAACERAVAAAERAVAAGDGEPAGMAVSPGAGPGSYRVVVSSGQMIDWELAISTGVRWVRPGPQVSLAEARAVVSELHELAAAVAEPVRQVTGMSSAEEIGRVAVVDRPGWIRANVDG